MEQDPQLKRKWERYPDTIEGLIKLMDELVVIRNAPETTKEEKKKIDRKLDHLRDRLIEFLD